MKNRPLPLILASAAVLSAAVPARATEIPLLDDTNTSAFAGTTKYGAALTLAISQAASGAALNRRAWLKFDVASALPAGTTWDLVQKATLTVYVNTLTVAGKVNVLAAAAPWLEADLTHNTAPALRGADAANNPFAQKTVSTVDKYVTFDVTELVRDWLDGTLVNHGLVLTAGDATVNVQIDSKEATANSHPATLDVTLLTRRVLPAGDVSMGQFTVGPRP